MQVRVFESTHQLLQGVLFQEEIRNLPIQYKIKPRISQCQAQI